MGSIAVRVMLLSIGGAFGVNARYWLAIWVDRRVGPRFPWATFSINVSGSFAIGLLSALLARLVPHPYARIFVIVGFLGGYTTFSSFSLEALALVQRGALGLSLAYMGGSVASGFLAVVLGVALGEALAPPAHSRDKQEHEVRHQEEQEDRQLVQQDPAVLNRVDDLGRQPKPSADPMLQATRAAERQGPDEEKRIVDEPAPEEHGS